MARVYRLTTDMSEKEKVIGGILTLGQGMWLVTGLLIAAGVFMALVNTIPKGVALFIGIIPGAAIAVPFAFYEPGGLKLSEYIRLRVKFRKKTKFLTNTMTYKIDRAADFARENADREVEVF